MTSMKDRQLHLENAISAKVEAISRYCEDIKITIEQCKMNVITSLLKEANSLQIIQTKAIKSKVEAEEIRGKTKMVESKLNLKK